MKEQLDRDEPERVRRLEETLGKQLLQDQSEARAKGVRQAALCQGLQGSGEEAHGARAA